MPGLNFTPEKNFKTSQCEAGLGFIKRDFNIVLIVSTEAREALWERTAHTLCRYGLLSGEPCLNAFVVAMCAASVVSAALSQRLLQDLFFLLSLVNEIIG